MGCRSHCDSFRGQPGLSDWIWSQFAEKSPQIAGFSHGTNLGDAGVRCQTRNPVRACEVAHEERPRNRSRPLILERLRAGWQYQHGRTGRGELKQARSVRLALGDEPLERVEAAGDDRAQPRRRLLRPRLGRGSLERAVLDRGDAAVVVAACEGDLDRAALADP